MIEFFKTKKRLIAERNAIEQRTIERERKRWFDDKLGIINEYESKIIEAAESAANQREVKMIEIIDKKDDRIRALELQIVDIRKQYRTFKEDVRQHEMVIDKIRTQLAIGRESIGRMYGIFEGIGDEIERVNIRIEKKDRKMLNG
jgi:hypothetical protein